MTVGRLALALSLASAVCRAQRAVSPSLPDLEKQLRSYPDPARAREYMKRMAAEPHHAGAPGSKAVAEYALGLLKRWGFDARIEEFEALLPYPTETLVELTAPAKLRLELREPVTPADPDSGDRRQLPLYNAYSASGDVTAPLVYVNYGIPQDYARLEKLGVTVKGKIAITRYGGSWRGAKPKVAAEHGAVACLIYSDPHDDGYYQGDPFPKGPYRPAESAQRGSVMDMPVAVGDPLTPGWASEKGGRRLRREEAATIMKIPVLPLSWSDAKPLLERLGGPVAPPEWRGALPITYRVGGAAALVRVKTEFDWTSKPIYNVIARMKGAVAPDEWVIYGNHHDAWVNGAGDPVSGAVALLETARAFSRLKATTNWQPRRTLMFALWDAEEFGLIGSTEWVEKHRDELQRKTVAYFNTDMNTGGKLGVGGSPMLEKFFSEVIRDIEDPAKGKSLLALAEAAGEDGTPGQPFALGALGAGSDYVAFLHHAGIPSLNLGFAAAGSAGVYHSIYDSYAWFSRHMDKDFQYSRLLSQVVGTAMLRMSESEALPYDFRALARVVRQWAIELERQHKLDLRELVEAAGKLEAAGEQLSGDASRRRNRELLTAERLLTRAQGLPGREWFKHQLYAPGLYTGYSAKTLPGIREAAEAGRMDEARQEAAKVTESVRRLAQMVQALAGGF